MKSDYDGLEARLKEPFSQNKHLQVGFPTSPVMLLLVQRKGIYGRNNKTTYCKWQFGNTDFEWKFQLTACES